MAVPCIDRRQRSVVAPGDGELKPFPLVVGTVPIWANKGRDWRPVLGTVDVIEPEYGRPYKARIYKIRGEDARPTDGHGRGRRPRFAACVGAARW